MCEGSFLPSSFGPHQKHTEFESSLHSYPIIPFALFAKGWGLFSRSRRESAFTHLSSEERRDESLLSNTCHSESALAVRNLLFAGVPHPFALFAKGCGLFSRSRRESAFTHLSFRGAPRREPAFKYLSFRIRFSGEESAVQRADRNDSC